MTQIVPGAPEDSSLRQAPSARGQSSGPRQTGQDTGKAGRARDHTAPLRYRPLLNVARTVAATAPPEASGSVSEDVWGILVAEANRIAPGDPWHVIYAARAHLRADLLDAAGADVQTLAALGALDVALVVQGQVDAARRRINAVNARPIPPGPEPC